MTDKNLLYFVTRMNLAVHDMELHFAQSQRYLVELLRREQNALADIGEIKDASAIEVCDEVRLARDSAGTASRIAHEMHAWFKEHCPVPTKKRDLTRGLKTLEHFYRSFRPENGDQKYAQVDGVLGMVHAQSCALSLLKDNLGHHGRPHVREELEEAVRLHDQEVLLNMYLDSLRMSERVEQVMKLQREWCSLAIAAFLDH